MRFLVTGGIYRASGASLRTIETVVEENPLSFATSRMVTIEALPLDFEIRSAYCRNPNSLDLALEFIAEVGGHYSRE
jgi:hypothetical protein